MHMVVVGCAQTPPPTSEDAPPMSVPQPFRTFTTPLHKSLPSSPTFDKKVERTLHQNRFSYPPRFLDHRVVWLGNHLRAPPPNFIRLLLSLMSLMRDTNETSTSPPHISPRSRLHVGLRILFCNFFPAHPHGFLRTDYFTPLHNE